MLYNIQHIKHLQKTYLPYVIKISQRKHWQGTDLTAYILPGNMSSVHLVVSQLALASIHNVTLKILKAYYNDKKVKFSFN